MVGIYTSLGWPIFRGKLAVVYWGVFFIHHETQLWKVHSLAEHAAFSCEGTTSFFIAPGMCFGEEIHEIHEIQGERWMRVDAATHACCAHIRPMTITCCTCCFKDALSNFQVLNNSQCGDVQICFMFMQICPNKSFVERSSCLLFPFFWVKTTN